MQKKQNFLPFFLVFFGLSIILILIGTSGIFNDFSSIFNKATIPGRSIANVFMLRSIQGKYKQELIQENLKLKKALSDQKNILNENIALKSQFESAPEISQSLIPAAVVGFPGFIPGVSLPEYLIINKGESAGIKNNDAVVSNNYLIGKVVKTYKDIAKVQLIMNKNSSFTAKVEGESDINGIIKGQGNEEIILDNVLLTQELKKDSEVLTKGDKNEKGEGYPPNINIGKIYSIDKKQSDLFQRATVRSPIDISQLDIVFVLQSRN